MRLRTTLTWSDNLRLSHKSSSASVVRSSLMIIMHKRYIPTDSAHTSL